MPLTMEKVRAWRARAREIRVRAANYHSQEAQAGMLEAARGFELLAAEIEAWLIGKSDQRRSAD